MKNYKIIYDKVGILLSSFCLLHCILTPIILIFFPFLIKNNHDFTFHAIMLFFVVLFSFISFKSGLNIHQNKKPAMFASVGIIILLLNLIFHEIFHDIEFFINLLGSFLIIIAHIKNKKHCKKCEH